MMRDYFRRFLKNPPVNLAVNKIATTIFSYAPVGPVATVKIRNSADGYALSGSDIAATLKTLGGVFVAAFTYNGSTQKWELYGVPDGPYLLSTSGTGFPETNQALSITAASPTQADASVTGLQYSPFGVYAYSYNGGPSIVLQNIVLRSMIDNSIKHTAPSTGTNNVSFGGPIYRGYYKLEANGQTGYPTTSMTVFVNNHGANATLMFTYQDQGEPV